MAKSLFNDIIDLYASSEWTILMIQRIAYWAKFILTRTWQFFASVVIVLFVFLNQFHDFKSPDVVLEVTSVRATSSQPVDLVKFPELSSLKSLIANDETRIFSKGDIVYSPEDIDRTLLIYKNNLSTLENEIDRVEKRLGSGISGEDPKSTFEKLSNLNDSIESTFYRRALFIGGTSQGKNDKDTPIEQKIENLKSNIASKLDEKRRDKDNSSAKYKEANKQWTTFKSTVMPNRTKLVIICAVGNQGSGATSLKPQALFRANLGEGNYLDFPMKMSDYDSSPEAATLQPQSYKVIKFESDEIQSMTAADRERFKSFLGNASPARIFVSDVRGEVYASNSVPFSPGVYEQKMFDSLKQFASSKTFK